MLIWGQEQSNPGKIAVKVNTLKWSILDMFKIRSSM